MRSMLSTAGEQEIGVSDLIDTTEMYLRTIFELEEEGIVPLRARIAERLRQSGPTVSQTVARMERDGLLRVTGDRHLELSPGGRERAAKVMRKHRLAERLLTDVIGVDWENVHEEACRWEHVISDDVAARLVELLGDPVESPYGNPIPGRAERPGGVVPSESEPIARLVDDNEPVTVRIRSIGEGLQAGHGIMADLRQCGILPGSTAVLSPHPDGFLLEAEQGDYVLDTESAEHLYAEVVGD